jgi:hypothetical protein
MTGWKRSNFIWKGKKEKFLLISRTSTQNSVGKISRQIKGCVNKIPIQTSAIHIFMILPVLSSTNDDSPHT